MDLTVRNKSHLFGSHDAMTYLHTMLKENNIIVLCGGVLGLLTSSWKYAIPYVSESLLLSYEVVIGVWISSDDTTQTRTIYLFYIPHFMFLLRCWVSMVTELEEDSTRDTKECASGRR